MGDAVNNQTKVNSRVNYSGDGKKTKIYKYNGYDPRYNLVAKFR